MYERIRPATFRKIAENLQPLPTENSSPTFPKRGVVFQAGIEHRPQLPAGIPDFAISPSPPFKNPMTGRERVMNYIWETLQEHPHRWFSATPTSKATGISRQGAQQILSTIKGINVLGRKMRLEERKTLREQVDELRRRGYTGEEIVYQLGIPHYRLRRELAKSIFSSPSK